MLDRSSQNLAFFFKEGHIKVLAFKSTPDRLRIASKTACKSTVYEKVGTLGVFKYNSIY